MKMHTNMQNLTPSYPLLVGYRCDSPEQVQYQKPATNVSSHAEY